MPIEPLIALFLAALAPAPGRAVPRPKPTIIFRHEAGGLCLDDEREGCSTYTVTLGGDGEGSVVRRHGQVDAPPVPFHASAAEQRAFRDRLAVHRPQGDMQLESGRPCRQVVTDGDYIDVRWTGDGSPARLRLYSGCVFPGHDQLRDDLLAAPRLLPISTVLPRPDPARR